MQDTCGALRCWVQQHYKSLAAVSCHRLQSVNLKFTSSESPLGWFIKEVHGDPGSLLMDKDRRREGRQRGKMGGGEGGRREGEKKEERKEGN